MSVGFWSIWAFVRRRFCPEGVMPGGGLSEGLHPEGVMSGYSVSLYHATHIVNLALSEHDHCMQTLACEMDELVFFTRLGDGRNN